MRIHFLNVGHGDCTIVEFEDRIMVVDINNGQKIDSKSRNEILYSLMEEEQDRLFLSKMLNDKNDYYLDRLFEDCDKDGRFKITNPIEYMKENNIYSIFRFIVTHPHMDHISGLRYIRDHVHNFWITNNNFEKTKEDFLKAEEYEDWKTYLELKQRIGTGKPDPKVLDIREGSKGQYYTDDNIKILSPNERLIELAEEQNNENIMSTVILIEYKGAKILLPGDAEKETWEYIYEEYRDEIKDIDILKASHHGRDSGYHQKVVKHMNPEYVIVSVGKKPDTDASNKYKNYCNNVLSTRWNGNIIFDIDDSGIISKK